MVELLWLGSVEHMLLTTAEFEELKATGTSRDGDWGDGPQLQDGVLESVLSVVRSSKGSFRICHITFVLFIKYETTES